MRTLKNKKLIAVYTDIGRGHPNYLDTTLRVLKKRLDSFDDMAEISSVFKLSKGLSLAAWKIVRKLYHAGAQGGRISSIYNSLRSEKNSKSKSGIIINLLGKDLRHILTDFDGLVVVAHPLLAQILSSVCNIYYIHGEIASPMEFDISKCEKIFVPLKNTAAKMIANGLPENIVEITGLMLEPELVNSVDHIQEDRIRRINAGQKQTIGFFTSGAYPKEHVRQIRDGISYILNNKLGSVVLSVGTDSGIAGKFRSDFTGFDRNKLTILSDNDRQSLTLKELEYLNQLDLMVFAAHERVNWSLSLGIPTILLSPNFGNYAEQNFQFTEMNGLIYSNCSNDIKKCIDAFIRDHQMKSPDIMKPPKNHDVDGADYTANKILDAIEN